MKVAVQTYLLILFISIVWNPIFSQQDTSCVGESGSAIWYVYSDIEGRYINNLYEDASYPLSPSYELPMQGIKITKNFNNDYGSIVRGFIKVPETGTYVFNVTGNNSAHFYFSDGTTPSTMTRIAYTDTATNDDEHNKYTTQTSANFALTADRYHYFELHHKESMYGDHATVFWRTPLHQDTIWRVVNSAHIYQYDCFSACPTEGTPCDDGDPNTTNDQEDGYCNCIGEYTSSNSCVGHRGDLFAMIYDSISGGGLNNLYNAAKYPLSPDTGIVITEVRTPSNLMAQYGTLIKGYLRVPVAGSYTFNLTGDDQSQFFLSSDDQATNLSMIAEVEGWTRVNEHYKYAAQTSAAQELSNDQFYYFEVHHKEGWGGDHVNVYWKLPVRPDTSWVPIQSSYIYGVADDCEMACPPQGTPCNDHDDNTSNDQYDANCNCVGTPCNGPCDEDDYQNQPLCGPTNRYVNHEMDSWLSCEKSTNPNAQHGNTHFILYDFGSPLIIERNHYWNYNVENKTDKGIKTVIIDYAETPNDWQNIGTFSWAEASGLTGYLGDSIPQLNNIRMRYLLFTVTETWGDTCAGFSELLLDVRRCFDGGTPCDDGDPATIGDMYDNDCNCIGIPAVVSNPCDSSVLIVDDPIINTDDYNADVLVRGEVGRIEAGHTVTFTSANTIELADEFEVQLGSHFYASIAPCVTMRSADPPTAIHRVNEIENLTDQDDKEYLQINEGDDARKLSILFKTARRSHVTLAIENEQGSVYTFIDGRQLGKGTYKKHLPVQTLTPGVYHVVLTTRKNRYRERFVVATNN